MAFAGVLRQATAVDVLIGPFVDSTDGDAEETGLTIAQADVRLSKSGQAAAQKSDATTCAHDADGFYNCELDATDTGTVGQLTLYVHVAGALAVRHDFQVIEEAVYDRDYAAAATGLVTLAAVTHTGATIPTVTTTGTATAVTTVNGLAANVITAAAINADAITAAKIATDAITEIQSGLATAAALATVDSNVDAILVDTAEIGAAGAGLTEAGGTGDHLTALATAAALTTVDGIVDAILVDTADMQPKLGTPAVSISADIAAIEAQTDDIGAAGAGLTAVPWNAAWDAEVQSEVQDAIEANHLDHLLAATYDPASKPGAADALLNELVENDAGVARYTANALEQAPTGGSAPTVGQIADAVWDEDLTGHVTADTAGAILGDVATGTPPTASAIADEVETRTIAAVTTVNGLAANVVTAAALAADAVTEIQSGLATSAALATVDGVVDAILVDTAEIGTAGAGLTEAGGTGDHLTALATQTSVNDLPTNAELEARTLPSASYATATALQTVDDEIATIDSNVDAILVDTGTTLQAEIDGIQADTEDIQSRLPAALVSGRMSSDAVAISGSTTAADKLESHAAGVLNVVVGTGSTTTAIVLNATTGINGAAPSATNDFYNGRVLVFLTGSLAGQATDVTDYDGATVTATVTALTGAPSAGDTAVLV